jgi:hypothetical protein
MAWRIGFAPRRLSPSPSALAIASLSSVSRGSVRLLTISPSLVT